MTLPVEFIMVFPCDNFPKYGKENPANRRSQVTLTVFVGHAKMLNVGDGTMR